MAKFGMTLTHQRGGRVCPLAVGSGPTLNSRPRSARWIKEPVGASEGLDAAADHGEMCCYRLTALDDGHADPKRGKGRGGLVDVMKPLE